MPEPELGRRAGEAGGGVGAYGPPGVVAAGPHRQPSGPLPGGGCSGPGGGRGAAASRRGKRGAHPPPLHGCTGRSPLPSGAEDVPPRARGPRRVPQPPRAARGAAGALRAGGARGGWDQPCCERGAERQDLQEDRIHAWRRLDPGDTAHPGRQQQHIRQHVWRERPGLLRDFAVGGGRGTRPGEPGSADDYQRVPRVEGDVHAVAVPHRGAARRTPRQRGYPPDRAPRGHLLLCAGILPAGRHGRGGWITARVGPSPQPLRERPGRAQRRCALRRRGPSPAVRPLALHGVGG
mmetsp:Transcript_63660/g.201303  ORF Transcript_63660/g.201303 Transcript_63660/m.201303 type:complete len:292 (+) Transcript_63660:1210-2085(+)